MRDASFQITWAALAVAGRLDAEPLKGLIYGDLVASHLCGNSTCFEPKHIIIENQSLNNIRQACHARNECQKTKRHPEEACVVGIQVTGEALQSQYKAMADAAAAGKGLSWRLNIATDRIKHGDNCAYHQEMLHSNVR